MSERSRIAFGSSARDSGQSVFDPGRSPLAARQLQEKALLTEAIGNFARVLSRHVEECGDIPRFKDRLIELLQDGQGGQMLHTV